MKDYKKGKTFRKNMSRSYGDTRNINLWMKIMIWFSDVLNVIGLTFFLISLPFVFVFGFLSDFSATNFDENDPVIKGVIEEVNSTSSSVNEETVYEYKYIYKPDGGEYIGVGYGNGVWLEVGDQVDVKYKRNSPEISEVESLRANEFPAWIMLFIFIFPITGIVMLYFGTKKAINAMRILKYGEIAHGKYISMKATNTKINEQTVYDLTFEFTAKDNKVYQTHAKTHKYQSLQDDEFEKLVYDRDDPENAVLVDVLPRSVRKYFEKEI